MNKPEQKTRGLIGGMGWESTVPYHREINQAVKEQLGGLHIADTTLHARSAAHWALADHPTESRDTP